MSEYLEQIDLDGPQLLSVLKFLKRIIVLFWEMENVSVSQPVKKNA